MTPQEAINSIPYAVQLGIRLHENLENGCVFKTDPEQRFMGNPILEAYHGGILCGLMDCAMAVTIMSRLGRAKPPAIINQTTSYLGSAALHSPISVRTEITKPGKRIIGAYARAYQKSNRQQIMKRSEPIRLQRSRSRFGSFVGHGF